MNMEVVSLFKWWQSIVYPGKKDVTGRVHGFVLGSKPFAYFLLVLMATIFLGAVIGQASAMQTLTALRLPISIVPCFVGVHFFAFRRQALHRLLQDGAVVAADLCAAAPHAQVSCGRLLSLSRNGYRVMQLWSGVAAFSVMAPVIIQGRPAMAMWPWFDGALGAWLGGAVQAASAYPMAFPIYVACILMWSITEALAALFVITGEGLAHSVGLPQACQVARCHAHLCRLSQRAAGLIDVVLASMTVGLLLTPAISTVMVVRGTFDVFCATSIPFLLPFYVMCRAGQNLEDASEGVSDSALACFGGLLETRFAEVRVTRVLLLTMTRATKPSSMEVFRGTVRYNLRTCHEAFKSWYSMLQYLLNVPDGS